MKEYAIMIWQGLKKARERRKITMKKMLMLALALILGLCPALAEGAAITQEEALRRMAENPYLNLFDLRLPEEYDAAHLSGAVNFPLDSLEEAMQGILDEGFSYMEAEIIVYGASDADGESAVEILNRLGFSNAVSLGTIGNWSGEMISTQAEIEEGMRLLGDLDTADLYGNPVDASLLSGHRLTMVNVWATYCNPCIDEMPELSRLHADMQEKGVQVVGLLCDVTDAALTPVESKIKLAQDIVTATGADYPQLLPSAALNEKVLYQITAVPTTFFVDETGRIVGNAYMGSRNYDAWAEIIDAHLALLAE